MRKRILSRGGDPGVSLAAAALLPALLGCGARTGIDDGATAHATAGTSASCPADVCTPPISCVLPGPGRTDCGGAGSAAESCCTSPTVPGGTFDRTYATPGIGGGNTVISQHTTVSAFRLDRFLVTVGRFRLFVAAWNGGWLPDPGSGKHVHLNGGRGLADLGGGYESGWVSEDDAFVQPTTANLSCHTPSHAVPSASGTWTYVQAANENLPIDCVTWQEAFAFCIWDGGFLPSEAEWQYAAAGGSEEREYPWGTTDPGSDNEYAIYGCHYLDGNGACAIAPVGWAARGAARWGQLDISGDVMEWMQDWVTTANSPFAGPCVDCTVGSSSPQSLLRSKRGAHFGSDRWSLALTQPWEDSPTTRDPINGFRCARAP
jgi:formylglycine-generating enzyme required for sulfatase activity